MEKKKENVYLCRDKTTGSEPHLVWTDTGWPKSVKLCQTILIILIVGQLLFSFILMLHNS